MGKINWKVPQCVKHNEVKIVMRKIANDMEEVGVNDIPILTQMANALEMYYKCYDILMEEGPTMTNAKGEIVKRPEVNIARDCQNLYIMAAKELGLTRKSMKILNGSFEVKDSDTELDAFVKMK